MMTPKKFLSLRIELLRVTPMVWRRLMVPANITLPELDLAIQAAMGWTNSHLHKFEIGDHTFMPLEVEALGEADDGDEIGDEAGKKLASLLGKDMREFLYEYDFGDGWQHRIVLEKTEKAHPAWDGPVCVAGERACPPEDVGGAYGYQEFLRSVSDPDDEEHVSVLRWVGGVFDPAGFDINCANERIRQFL